MFSSDRNIDIICKLITDIKEYVELKEESMKIEMVSKMSKLCSALILCITIFLVLAIALIFASLLLAAILTPILGSEILSYAVILLIYLIIAALLYGKRHTWFEEPITNFIGKLILEKASSKSQNKENPTNQI